MSFMPFGEPTTFIQELTQILGEHIRHIEHLEIEIQQLKKRVKELEDNADKEKTIGRLA